MKRYHGYTDIIHKKIIESEVRAFFSATGARLREEVWLHVEARWTADNTPMEVKLFRDEGTDGQELLKTFEGVLAGGFWEQLWKIELPKSQLDELHGPIHLRFEAQPSQHPGPAHSQVLLVHRTRFSS